MGRGISAWQSPVSKGFELVLESSPCKYKTGTGWGAWYGTGGSTCPQRDGKHPPSKRKGAWSEDAGGGQPRAGADPELPLLLKVKSFGESICGYQPQ